VAKTAKRAWTSHAEHGHPRTKSANAVCRRVTAKTGEPWDGTPLAGSSRAASTRKKNLAAQKQAEVVDTLLDLSDPRDDKGRFVRLTVDEWKQLIESLEGAQEWLVQNATLESARLEVTIGGQTLVATYDTEVGWSVGAE
jgi:hypothetical protein